MYRSIYDETKGSLSTFANQVIKNHNNLIRKHSRTTPKLENNVQQESYCFEDVAILHVDIEKINSKLQKKQHVLCEQLKHYSIAEVADTNNINELLCITLSRGCDLNLHPLTEKSTRKIE